MRVAELHRNAVAPDGKFGFYLPSGGSTLPMKLAQSTSWEHYLIRYLWYLFRAEQLAQGKRSAEMAKLIQTLFDRVIPRLIRPLETGGRTIVPRLVHTNIWSRNRALNEDGEDILRDPRGFYAHNEFELGVWSLPREPFGKEFLDNYHKHFVSETQADLRGSLTNSWEGALVS